MNSFFRLSHLKYKNDKLSKSEKRLLIENIFIYLFLHVILKLLLYRILNIKINVLFEEKNLKEYL